MCILMGWKILKGKNSLSWDFSWKKILDYYSLLVMF